MYAVPSPSFPSRWMTLSRGSFGSEEHTSELQSQSNLVCRLLLEKKKEAHKRPDPYVAVLIQLTEPQLREHQLANGFDTQLHILGLGNVRHSDHCYDDQQLGF